MSEITVTLDQTTDPWTLDVSDQDLDVPQNANAAPITWRLSDMPSGISWANDTEHQPLTWLVNAPQPGIFTDHVVNGEAFTLNDHNDNSSSVGAWSYQLCVTDGEGNYYFTSNTSSPKAGGGSAPTITNQ